MGRTRCLGPTPGIRCPHHALAMVGKPRCRDCYLTQQRRRNNARPWYLDPDYRRASTHLNRTATNCWRCGQPFTAEDPCTTDHHPAVALVTDWRECELRPAHRRCNSVHGGATRRPRAV